MASLLKFIRLLLQESSLNNPIQDVNLWRTQSLKGLEEFLPESYSSSRSNHWTQHHPALFNTIATASHIKNSFKDSAGHVLAEKAGVFYVRIPKAGSTSILSEMLGLLQPTLKKETLTATQVNFLADTWLQADLQNLNNFTGFTIVRHPLARLASVYRDIFENHENRPFIYQHYLAGILPKNISFDEFVSRINRIPDKLKDQHLKPQYLFLRPYQANGIRVTVLKLEDPASILSFLKSYGLGLPHLNQSPAYSYLEYYSKKSLLLAQNMYGHDFRMFNYEQKLNK
jgi:hypothetical protein